MINEEQTSRKLVESLIHEMSCMNSIKQTHDHREGELSHHHENLRTTKESNSAKIIKACKNFEHLKS